jgi:hypothetical protein
MRLGGRSSVLIAAIVLGFAALSGALSTACGTLLGIQPDDSTPVTTDGGNDLDAAPTLATGDACIFDDPGSKYSDICGFGP